MKKTLILLCAFNVLALFSQTSPLDAQLVNINKATVTSGIIYERVTPMANLYEYNQNGSLYNTANYQLFEQALSELHRASNETRLISHLELRNRLNPISTNMAGAPTSIPVVSQENIVNIGIINSPFEILNYNFENPSEGGLNFSNNLYSQIAGKAPFFSLYALIIAPLKKYAVGNTIEYKFNTNFILNNGTKRVKNLVVNFGDGVLRTVISNGAIVLPNVSMVNNFTGMRTITFNVTFNDNFTITTYGKIYLQTASASSGGMSTTTNGTPETASSCATRPLIEDWYGKNNRLEADLSYSGKKGQLEARIFYHNKTNTSSRTMLKPLLIIDGFDPGDKRRIEDCDCNDDPDCKTSYLVDDVFNANDHKSFFDLMEYKDENDVAQNFTSSPKYI